MILNTYYDQVSMINRIKNDKIFLKRIKEKFQIQLPLGSLRTFDVTHFRLVTHFYSFNIAQIEIVVYFN